MKISFERESRPTMTEKKFILQQLETVFFTVSCHEHVIHYFTWFLRLESSVAKVQVSLQNSCDCNE
jgi:hypothetical protein